MLLTAALLVTAGLAGCLQGEPIDPTATDGDPSADSGGDGHDHDDHDHGDEAAAGVAGTDDDGNGSSSSDNARDAGANETPPDLPGPAPTVEDRPLTVLAHLDTGINPYHEAFRDDTDLADVHPSEYIEGYPEDVPALNLTLDAASYEEAVREDEDVWRNVTPGQLYWIPGTRIDGAITFGGGGTYCPILGLPHDYIVGPLLNGTVTDCPDERKILDDFGHGTMTASRSVGEDISLCETCRLVSVEGLGADPVRWVADQGWIDVQTNSWVSLIPAPANQAQDGQPFGGDDTTTDATAYAAEKMVTIFASGNGAAYLAGFAPTPTYTLSTAPPGVILVGAHDNGYITPWSGSPPHVIADGFRGLAAANDSLSKVGPIKFTCCTSSSAPYAAGGAAQVIQAARTILSDTGNGIQDGVIAEGDPGAVPSGPLSDGVFNMSEFREVYFHTAQIPPQEGPHDGIRHWASEPSGGPNDATNPAGNPYCGGCWTAPIPYDALPPEVPTFVYTGYGSISPASVGDATEALAGGELPAREQADQFYALDQTVRSTSYP